MSVLGEPSQEEVNEGLENRIINILRDQAIEYNNTDNTCKIDLDQCKTKVELAISLWSRNVSIQSIFGAPYDTTFRDYCQYTLMLLPSDIPAIDASFLYLMLQNYKIIVGILLYRINEIDLSKHGNPYWIDTIRNVFREMGHPLVLLERSGAVYYPIIKSLLRSLSDIQITYLAIKFNTVGIFNSAEFKILLREAFC